MDVPTTAMGVGRYSGGAFNGARAKSRRLRRPPDASASRPIGVICVGADAPSVDSFNEVAVRMIQPVHMMCRERGVLNIESLRNIDLIPKRAFTFVGLPLKIKNGCGSPIRAVALTGD